MTSSRLLLPLASFAFCAAAFAADLSHINGTLTKEPGDRIDRYGDPLPEGAILRLGTVRFRYPCFRESHRQLLGDGKTLVISAGDELRWVDTETGRYVR